MILAGRRINDRMGAHVAETVVKLMLQSGIGVCHSRVLTLGLASNRYAEDDYYRDYDAFRAAVGLG